MARGDPIVAACARVAGRGAGAVAPAAVAGRTDGYRGWFTGYRRQRPARFVVPAGTPREIVLKLDDAAQEALADKEVIAGLVNKNALVLEGGLPERLAAVIHDDLARWSRMVKMTGFKPEIGAVLSRREPRHRACRAARSGRCRP